jgi:hypothetical protein
MITLLDVDKNTKLARKFIPAEYAENQKLIVLFSVLLQNSKNKILFHPSMIQPLLQMLDFVKLIQEDIFNDLYPLKPFLKAQLLEDAKLNLADGETIDEADLVKKVDLLIKASNAHLQRLKDRCLEEKQDSQSPKQSKFSMGLFPATEESIPTSINFVWIKCAKTRFPSLPLDKSFVTNGNALLEQLIPLEHVTVLKDWVNTYGNQNVIVWLDSRLLEKHEYDALVLGLSTLGVQTKDTIKSLPDDKELQKIPEIVDYFSKNAGAANLGYIIDLIKFKAMFYFAMTHSDKPFVYIHSDFDYNPIAKSYFRKELGFQTHWGAGKTIENDFFICDHAHFKKHPGLLAGLNEKHSEIIQNNMFKNHTTNDLFRFAYHDPLMLKFKSLTPDERESFKVEPSALDKHSHTKHHFRTWD